jgi:hypothetical protein
MSDQTRYDHTRYDRYDVLRPNWAFWAMALFLSRHLVFLLLLGISHGKGGGSSAPNPSLGALIEPVYFISDIPALVLMYVAGNRVPAAGNALRFLWRNGRTMLILAIIAYFGLMVFKLGAAILDFHLLTVAIVVINLVILAALLTNRYFRDLFAQFPAPAPEPPKPGG